MQIIARAGLAAAVFTCAFLPAVAQPASLAKSQWLTDAAKNCAVFDAGAQPGDQVSWTGDCDNGLASGLGTATFTRDGKAVESFTADFTGGMAADGHVIVHWGDGWNYDGGSAHGRFEGGGLLVNAAQDRFQGVWSNGKLNGYGVVQRANDERYAGEWKDDLPNGQGELRHADGSVATGLFRDGKLTEANVAQASSPLKPVPAALKTAAPVKSPQPFGDIPGHTLHAVDGSTIALDPIDGGIELALAPVGGTPQKTTFTFMNDRLGTVVEDGGPSSGANVTGFFRVTDNGVEVRYADGRAETLSLTGDGGIALVLEAPAQSARCRSWYPDGHVFSEDEKKAALADYASRIGLAIAADNSGAGCPATPRTALLDAPHHAAHLAAHLPVKPVKAVKTAFVAVTPPSALPNTLPQITTVAVKDSQVHLIDGQAPSDAEHDTSDASHCLKVDSDGDHWGFRNSCAFAVQFAYCMAGNALAGCDKGGATGSVAARGFGALTADHSLSESGVDHNFRWVACAGGAGEVAAHLDHADPPSGRCERAPTLTAAAH